MTEATPKHSARHDIVRTTKSYDDLLRIVAAYYEMYEKGARFLTPYISRQNNSNLPFIPPDKDQVKTVMGKPRSVMHPVIHHQFVNELVNFAERTKGKRALISPHQTTHHSAQFSSGTFEIVESKAKLPGNRKSLHQVTVFGSELPFFIENMQLTPEQVNFIIVRPKIGKLGTASVSNWEVLLYKSSHTYLINHVDSDLNPRWSGIL